MSSKTTVVSLRASANTRFPIVRTVAGMVMRSALTPRSASSAIAVTVSGTLMVLPEPRYCVRTPSASMTKSS